MFRFARTQTQPRRLRKLSEVAASAAYDHCPGVEALAPPGPPILYASPVLSMCHTRHAMRRIVATIAVLRPRRLRIFR